MSVQALVLFPDPMLPLRLRFGINQSQMHYLSSEHIINIIFDYCFISTLIHGLLKYLLCQSTLQHMTYGETTSQHTAYGKTSSILLWLLEEDIDHRLHYSTM